MRAEMNEATRFKLFGIRLRSKCGAVLTAAEQRFCVACFRQWPDAYRAMSDTVNQEAIKTVNPLYAPAQEEKK